MLGQMCKVVKIYSRKSTNLGIFTAAAWRATVVIMSRSLSERPSSYCLIHFGGSLGAAGQKTTSGRRQPLTEDDF